MDENKKQLLNFAYNITSIRNHYRIPKKRMAALLRISTGSLNKMEKGDISGRMSVAVLISAARQFRFQPSVLLNHRLNAGTFLEENTTAGERLGPS